MFKDAYSYQEITRKCQSAIETARECWSAADGNEKLTWWARGQGALVLWDLVTMGQQKPGDLAAMRDLANFKESN